MLNLILGLSGYGKTNMIFDRICDDIGSGKKVFLIVPEQQAYISERQILPRLPESSALNFEILNFSSLSRYVSSIVGGGAVASVSKPIRELMMWYDLRKLRGMLKEYNTFQGSDISFSSEVLRTVDELKVNRICPSMLEEASDALALTSPRLSAKLYDLSLISASFNDLMSDRFFDSPEDMMTLLARSIDGHDIFSGAHFYIDSFTDFTQTELSVIKALMRRSESVTVALSVSRNGRIPIHLKAVNDTRLALERIANDLSVGFKITSLNENTRTSSDELKLISDKLWSFEVVGTEGNNDISDSIELNCADTIYAECTAAAEKILALKDKGYELGDISVTVRDTAAYRGIIDTTFKRYGIPLFLSEKSDIMSKPISRFVITALRIISRGFRTDDVIALLKTGLCPVDGYSVNIFEEYVYTWKISGNGFKEERFGMNPDGYTSRLSERASKMLVSVNETRKKVIPPLTTLEAKLKTSDNTEDKCRAIFDFLDEMRVRDKLTEIAEYELSSGDIKEAGETIRIYDGVLSSLSSLASILKDEQLTTDELISSLTLLFGENSLGSVPSVHNCVVVGSADTLRIENTKVMIVLGLNEGEFPMSVKDSGLLSEMDKEELSNLKMNITSRLDLLSSKELFYVYRAFTKPSEKLILFYRETGADGKARSKSMAISRMEALFPYLSEHTNKYVLGGDITEAGEEVEETEDAEYEAIPSDSPVSYDDSDNDDNVDNDNDVDCVDNDDDDDCVDKDDTDDETTEKITEESVLKVFGDDLYLDQSRIRKFSGCPYSFYSSYVLGLRDEKTARLRVADSGTFVHFILEHYLQEVIGKDGKISVLSDDGITSLVDRLIGEYVSSIYDIEKARHDGRLIHLLMRLRSIALEIVRSMTDELSHSLFTPVGYELGISKRRDELRPIEIKLKEYPDRCVTIGGKIDRVDIYKKDNDIFFRVVDYKTGKHLFNLKDMSENMDFQLLLYLFTLVSNKNKGFFGGDGETNSIPASAVYQSVTYDSGKPCAIRDGFMLDDSSVLSAFSDTDDPYFVGTKSKSGGKLLTLAEIQELQDELTDTVRETAEHIYSGVSRRTPSESACLYCSVKNSCPVAVKTKRKGG